MQNLWYTQIMPNRDKQMYDLHLDVSGELNVRCCLFDPEKSMILHRCSTATLIDSMYILISRVSRSII